MASTEADSAPEPLSGSEGASRKGSAKGIGKRKATVAGLSDSEPYESAEEAVERWPRKRSTARKKRQQIASDNNNAAEELEQLRTHVTSAAERCFMLGRDCVVQGNTEVALAYLCAAINVQPNELRYLAALCEVYYQRGQADQALAYAISAKNDESMIMTVDFLVCIIRYQFALGCFSASLSIFNDILALEPDNAATQRGLATAQQIIALEQAAKGYLAQTDWKSLTTCLDNLETAYPASTRQWQQWRREAQTGLAMLSVKTAQDLAGFPHFERGERHLAADQVVPAKQCFTAQLRSHTQHQPSRMRLLTVELIEKGDACIEQGQNNEAVSFFSKAIAIDPRSPAMHMLLLKRGLALFNNSAYSHALGDCTAAIQVNKNSHRGYHLRGMCHIALDDLKEAIACLDRALLIYDTVNPAMERLDWRAIVSLHLAEAKKQLQETTDRPNKAFAIEAAEKGLDLTLAAPPDYKNQAAQEPTTATED